MPSLCNEIAMHTERLSADYPVGTRAGVACGPTEAGQDAGCDDGAKADS